MSSMQDYVHLIAASLNDIETARLTEEAIKASNIFFYGELLILPSVQRLRENASYNWIFQLIEILCYGTIHDLQNISFTLNESLKPIVYSKLRKLSVLSLCAQENNNNNNNNNEEEGVLHISNIQNFIGFYTSAEAEELIIDMISDNLLRGRIHQREGILILLEFAARDVRRDEIVKIREKLESWCRNCEAQIDMLNDIINE